MPELTLQDIIKPENQVYVKTKLMTDNTLSYCPGCGHGTAHRLIMEVIEELGRENETIGIAPVGCSVLAYEFLNVDMQEAAHGRAPAVATAIKRLWPGKTVFSYQGDGDLAAIGTSETIHVCNRGEQIVMIFINNGIYGMTGGQMAPTTLPNMKTSTSPFGREVLTMGNPLKMTELVAQLPGTYYVTRQAVHTPSAVRKSKRAIRKAFQNQLDGIPGVSFVEIVSNCNSGWKMTPTDSNVWMEENMFPFYELGDLKVNGEIVPKK
ncbi:MAG: thiamine pyrophosphate-dependent enzyme [Bacteroidales bacterium]|nr:thiamine pyrophosphate-dependent enzyme [Bacteroidales bacterium]MCF6341492.1 thiamine pyrophosphate-dependent enzyme [Bacteroidales bacterium]